MGIPEKSLMTSVERTHGIASVLWVTFALNCLTALFEIVLGLTTHSMAILADGFHSLSDGTSNIIGLIGIHVAGHPADKDHPYGHQKFETLASVIIGAFLMMVCFGIIQRAAAALADPQLPVVTPVTFAVMAVTMAMNIFIVWYERRASRRFQSEFLISDSWHTMADIFVKIGVIVALIGVKMNLPILDPLFSIVIAVVIAAAAVSIVKRGSDILTDKAVLDPALIEAVVRKVGGVEDCHEIRTRGNRYAIYVDLHVLVDPKMSVEASHHLASIIERDIKKDIEGVQDVVVHIEPTTHDHTLLTG